MVAPVRRPDRLLKLQAARSYRWLMIATITALTELGRLDDAQQQLHDYRDMVLRFSEAPGPPGWVGLAGQLARARAEPWSAGIGHRREGIDRLTRAIFVQLRAAPFITRCDTELGEAGLHQPASPTLGLTEREQDVAVLIAKGMTNNKIAAELYLTPKTIEYHLGNIYSKLHISGRRELRRRLTDG